MKYLFTAVIISIFCLSISCNKDEMPTPVNTPVYDTSIYIGVYAGLYTESDNGVDSTGVFKYDTAYNYNLAIADGGNDRIVIVHGPISLAPVMVDSLGYFFFIDFNRQINGRFVGDSLYVYSKSLNGSYDYPQWFMIQQLKFAGKKQP